jgi:tetratricopeptide (TPR) repeat protein
MEEAEARCRAALELVPDEATGLEMLGDLLRDRGKVEEACELYRRASEAAPQRPSPEKKFAEVMLEIAERQRLRDAAHLLLEHPPSPKEQQRNMMMALLLSVLFPGLGQFYNREPIKGGLLVAGALICLWLGGDALFRLLFTVSAARPSGSVSSFGAWIGLLGCVLWLYGVIDAVVTAQKRGPMGGVGPLG